MWLLRLLGLFIGLLFLNQFDVAQGKFPANVVAHTDDQANPGGHQAPGKSFMANIVSQKDTQQKATDNADEYDESSSTEEEHDVVPSPWSTSRSQRKASSPAPRVLEARAVKPAGGNSNHSVYVNLQKGKGIKGGSPGGGAGDATGSKHGGGSAGGAGPKHASASGSGGHNTGSSGGAGGNKHGSGGARNGSAAGGSNGVGDLAGRRDGGTKGGAGSGMKDKPFGVSRARPSDVVDPKGYAFFQHKKLNQLGWLWLTKPRLRGRKDNLFDLEEGSDEGEEKKEEYDWEFGRYDRACVYKEYVERRNTMYIPPVHEEIKRMVDVQNTALARRFLQWQFEGPETPEQIAFGSDAGTNDTSNPLYNTFYFLQGTIDIFMEKICKKYSGYVQAVGINVPYHAIQDVGKVGSVLKAPGAPPGTTPPADDRFLPEQFVSNIFNLFLVLRNMTLPTGSNSTEDYATKADDDTIFKQLIQKCADTEEEIHWFQHSCGDQILSSDNPSNYACTPYPQYDFNEKYTDPILDTVWHMFNAVHAFCWKQFRTNPRFWHKYALIVANAFTVPMRQRWKSSLPESKFYTRLLGPDYREHFNTINRCTYAAVLRTDVPMLLPRFDSLSAVTFGRENFS